MANSTPGGGWAPPPAAPPPQYPPPGGQPQYPAPGGAPPSPPAPPYPQYGYSYGPPPVIAKTSGMAIASLVLALVSLLFFIFVLPPLLAVIFGHLALSEIKRGKRQEGQGMAVAGLVIGYLTLLGGIGFWVAVGTSDDDEPSAGGADTTVVLGTGDVQATLHWNTGDDMDLHVTDPDGFELYFATDVSPSGGELDVDQIPACGDDAAHVENIFWPPDGAPTGAYTVWVENFHDCDGSPTTASIEVRVQGELVVDEDVTLGEDESSQPIPFQLPG